ncbi:MAG: transporter substrate-binding protein [Deltaproteobacteria bacterium]|nr:transporter substrate-binding protein [Deltaproteobacteria bacterium]
MLYKNNRLVQRLVFIGLLTGSLLPFFCAPGFVAAQAKSNLSSSVTSESMTHVWVARERGLFKKYGVDMQFILIPAISSMLA